MPKFKTQQSAVFYLLLKGEEHNFLSIFKATGCSRFSDKIYKLRKKGIVFTVKRISFKTRYGTSGHYFNFKLDKKATPKNIVRELLKSIR
jgi:hypothetical protein